jgi:hypothetical protein
MKNLNINRVFYAILIALSFSLISCNNDDYDPTEGMIMYGETTDFYGPNPTPSTIRDAAIGKWYDDKGTLMLDIEKWQLNPDYPQTDPTKPYEHEFEYYLSSYFDGYNFPDKYWNGEAGITKNNIYIGGSYHLVVEGNQATLYIMRNIVQKVRVYKK